MILNSVLCVWNEEDIIESTIKHLFMQGCANVYIVDNGSTDKTIKNAIKSGAKLAATFETRYFSEDQKIAHLNTVVKYINEAIHDEQIWWLYVDADEFPNIEGGTIGNTLASLDFDIRALHGHMFDHIPSHPPYHIQGYHPIDFQPLCTKESSSKACLLRYDKGKKHLWSIGGAHDFITHGDVIPTLKNVLNIHHFRYRNPEYTFKRLKKLVDRNNDGIRNINWHKEYSTQISKPILSTYESRYNQLQTIYSKNKFTELKTHALPYDYKGIPRWYNVHTHEINVHDSYEKNIWIAMYYFFMKEYDIAICKFNDIMEFCEDNSIKLWIMVKIAECLLATGNSDAQCLISAIKKHENIEINNYIDTCFNSSITQKTFAKNKTGEIEFYRSEFAPGAWDTYEKMTIKIEKNISGTIQRSLRSKH